ncbi:MAG: ATP-binding protein [Patescibacteria group bacterium]|nr:ATP-binding protein [Patescibacteria group bacterium]
MTETFKNLKKYNYWYKKKIDIGFVRQAYLDKLKKYSENKLIKVLIGQRRVGKSYVMRQLIFALINQGVLRKNIFYLNKELVEFDEIKNYQDLSKLIKEYKKELKIKGKVYVFIDEVQEIFEWEKIINSLSQNHKESYELYISGSNSKMLSGELATLLSGRYVTFEIYPFSFQEYIEYFSLERNKQSFINYLKVGGLPELYKLNGEELKVNYINALKNTIFLEDIVHRHRIKDAHLLEALIKFMVDNIGNLFSVNKIVNHLGSHNIKIKHETVSNYIGYMLETYLIHEATRYDIKGKDFLTGNKKYYINDLAFKTYLSSGFDYGLSHSLENAMYIYFRSLGYNVFVGKIGEWEVDFIIEKSREKKYVQIAYIFSDKKVIEREFRSLEAINDAYEKIVISLDDISLGNKNGIKHILAWEIGFGKLGN